MAGRPTNRRPVSGPPVSRRAIKYPTTATITRTDTRLLIRLHPRYIRPPAAARPAVPERAAVGRDDVGVADLPVHEEGGLQAAGVEGIVGDGDPLRLFFGEVGVHEQRHADVEMVHGEVLALLIGARVPDL